MRNMSKGIIYIIISAFGFAMMSAFVKLAGDLPPIQKTFFRNIVAMAIAFCMILYYKESFFGKRENQKALLMRSFFGTLGIIANYYAIDHLILSDANMLNKLSPFFVILLSAWFLKEHINSKQLLAVLVAFAGSLFIIKPTFDVQIMPFMVGVLSAVFAAIAYTFVRFLGGKEKYYTIVFYFSFFSTVVLLPPMLWGYKPMTTLQLTYLLLSGVFATLGQFGITLAYRFAPAKEISIFDYSNIIFSAIISIFLFNQSPDFYSIIGYFVIFGASYYMYIYNKKISKAS